MARKKSDPLMLDQKTCGHYYYYFGLVLLIPQAERFSSSLKPECAGCLFLPERHYLIYISLSIYLYTLLLLLVWAGSQWELERIFCI